VMHLNLVADYSASESHLGAIIPCPRYKFKRIGTF